MGESDEYWDIGCVLRRWGFIACGVAFGNIKGSGNVVTQQMTISDFTKVETGHSFKVTITRANDFRVQVKGYDNLLEHLAVRRLDDTLIIRLKPGKSTRDATLEAEVSLPELAGVVLTDRPTEPFYVLLLKVSSAPTSGEPVNFWVTFRPFKP